MSTQGHEVRASRFVADFAAALVRRGMEPDEARETAERLRPVYIEHFRESLTV